MLATAKDTNGLRPIVVGEVFFQLINRSMVRQLRGPFKEHLSPHQFGISTLRDYEDILFGVQALFDLHLNWVMM